MIDIISKTIELSGTNYEIGFKLGKLIEKDEMLKKIKISDKLLYTNTQIDIVKELFDKWCPGLNEELNGFADALEINSTQVMYYAMTYLQPRCSQIAILPKKSNINHLLMARNYEFSYKEDDFTLVRTCIPGKNIHLGTSVMDFGRDEGINEYGLAITMSSCGFPVGNLEFMRNPAITGLQFWAVIRSLLENCITVNESLAMLELMPITYNINLIIGDKDNNIALFATLDGKKTSKIINDRSIDNSLFATNHPCFIEMQKIERNAMKHSVLRYELIDKYLIDNDLIDKEDLKGLLLSKYPNGLCYNYYSDYLGTTKSVVIDITESSLEICWGGRVENKWHKYFVSQSLETKLVPIKLENENMPSELIEPVLIYEE